MGAEVIYNFIHDMKSMVIKAVDINCLLSNLEFYWRESVETQFAVAILLFIGFVDRHWPDSAT
jgi:hypothetical protein